MRVDATVAGLLLIAAAVVTAGAYVVFDAGRGDRSVDTTAARKAAPVEPSLAAPQRKLPPSHPPVVESLPSGAAAREGKVPSDPARAFTHFRVGNHNVRAMYSDGAVIWVGTSGGVVRYDVGSGEFRTYDATSGLRSSGVFHLGKLRGRIAVGTYGGGLSVLDEQAQTWEHYSVPEGLGDAFVYHVLEDTRGDIWIATGAGVNRVRTGALQERAKWQLYTVESTRGGLPSDQVRSLAEGRGGSIWFATEGGVARFQDGKWASWKPTGAPDTPRTADGRAAGGGSRTEAAPRSGQAGVASASIIDHHVVALQVDRDGTVWAGSTGAGLAWFDGGTWKRYTTSDGLPSNHISALHADGNGQLWIGTDKGLAVLKEGRFRVMTTAHGLLADSVHSVMTTSDGGLWVGGFGGVARIRTPIAN